MAKTDVTVELFYSGVWNDITATNDVYTRDAIRITRGRPDEVSRIPPATLNLSIKNAGGKYSPRVPTSPLYGLIGRNTPIRVKVGSSIRFVGEVESWPQRWNVKGNDVWAPITAYGILRRLNAAGADARFSSALRRAFLGGLLATGLIAYWPLEDGKDATRAASEVAGVAPLIFTSAAKPGTSAEPQGGSLPYAVVDNTRAGFATARLPIPTFGASFFAFSAVVKGTMPRPAAARAVIYNVATFDFPLGTITEVKIVAYARWNGTDFTAANTGVDVLVTGGTGSMGSVVGGVANVNVFDGRAHDIHVRLDTDAADVNGQLWVDGVMVDFENDAGAVLGHPSHMEGPIAAAGTLGGTAADNTDTTFAFGHYAVCATSGTNPTPAAADMHAAAIGHSGESAADRISRLCDEESIAFTAIDPALAIPVGVQRPAPLVELFQDAADADGGMLFETRAALGLTYRSHGSLYNQALALDLNYPAGDEVAPPLESVEDTDAVVNDVTVRRLDGSSSTAVKETGTLSVQDQPAGIGRYSRDVTLVLDQDAQTVQQAAWRLHLGTWDEARYPGINLILTATQAAGKTALAANMAALDIGDRFAIRNPPAWLPPQTIEQNAQGFDEMIEPYLWSITVNATPALPYNVGILDNAVFGRLDNAACTLNEALDTTETGVDVISTGVPWGSQFPYDIMIGGERMAVTARSGAGLTQTLTVTRSVNGVVKSHSSGVPVRLFSPLRLAR